jgi:CRP/FNR family cyclic AMP-dependent transcriptional regulator
LFRGLSSAELARVNDLLGKTRFPAGAAIMTATHRAKSPTSCWRARSRSASSRPTAASCRSPSSVPGETVGEIAFADRGGRSADVVALEPTTMLWLDRTQFGQLRREIPALTENLLVLLARRLRLANAQLQAIATLDVHGRVARQLLALADAYGSRRPAPVAASASRSA